MKAKWLLILLIVFPYLCLAVMAGMFLWQGMLEGVLWSLAALVIVVTVPNVVYSMILSQHKELEWELLVWARRIKLFHVPLYLLAFALCIAMAVTVVGLLLVPVVLVALYAPLLPASMYALTGLHMAEESGTLERGEHRLHAVELFVPGLDMIAAVELYTEAHPKQ